MSGARKTSHQKAHGISVNAEQQLDRQAIASAIGVIRYHGKRRLESAMFISAKTLRQEWARSCARSTTTGSAGLEPPIVGRLLGGIKTVMGIFINGSLGILYPRSLGMYLSIGEWSITRQARAVRIAIGVARAWNGIHYT